MAVRVEALKKNSVSGNPLRYGYLLPIQNMSLTSFGVGLLRVPSTSDIDCSTHRMALVHFLLEGGIRIHAQVCVSGMDPDDRRIDPPNDYVTLPWF